jgi:organic hydroperoxide reductase OsmC/OhrA
MDLLHTACVEVIGGRIGWANARNGSRLCGPGAPDQGDRCPEHLLATAMAASFGAALDLEARQRGLNLAPASVVACVSLGHGDAGRFALSVVLRIRLPALAPGLARRLVQAAEGECPYARMARDGAVLRVVLVEQPAPPASES